MARVRLLSLAVWSPRRLAPLRWLFLLVGGALACGGIAEGSVEDGGASGVAGMSSMDDDCACDPIECGVGSSLVQNADGCCFHCEMDSSACEEQRRLYAEFRRELIDERTMGGCDETDDCGLFEDLTGCSPTCPIAIPNNSRRGIDDRLYAYAQSNCNLDCPPQAVPPCEPRPAPQCVMGRCQ